MKKIFILFFLLLSIACQAQDTTIILNFQTKARLVQYLTPSLKGYDDTAHVRLFHKWADAFRVANPPAGTSLVPVDTVKVIVLADLYREALNAPQGMASVGDDFKADILTFRNASVFLDRLLDQIDSVYADGLSNRRNRGRQLLTGKN